MTFAFQFFYFKLVSFLKFILILSSVKRFKNIFSPLLLFLASIIYLIGMMRSGGVDILNYKYDYIYHDLGFIFDPGYNLLVKLGNFLHLPFEGFLFCIGAINLFLLFKVCKYFNVNFGTTLAILLIHLIVVRDFSQMRVSLAINLALYAYTFPTIIRYFIYLFAGSVHFTSFALTGMLLSYKYYNQNRGFKKIIPFLGIFAIASSLHLLTFIDPRIDIYLNWDRKDYGQSVSNFNQLAFICFLLLMYVFKNGLKFDLFGYSFLFSIVVFISFSSVSIFSYRLTNVCFSLYPFFVAHTLNNDKNGIYKLCLITLLILIVSARSSTNDIINSIHLGD